MLRRGIIEGIENVEELLDTEKSMTIQIKKEFRDKSVFIAGISGSRGLNLDNKLMTYGTLHDFFKRVVLAYGVVAPR